MKYITFSVCHANNPVSLTAQLVAAVRKKLVDTV